MSEPVPARSFTVREACADDLEAVLALNREWEHVTSPLTLEELERLHDLAALHLVAVDGGELLAFALVFGPGIDYDSISNGRPLGAPAGRSYETRLANAHGGCLLLAVLAGGLREGDGLTLVKGLEALALDLGEVDEEILAVLTLDEAVALVRVEPLDLTFRHTYLPSRPNGANKTTRLPPDVRCVTSQSREPVWPAALDYTIVDGAVLGHLLPKKREA